MFLIYVQSEGKEKLARELAQALTTRLTFATNSVVETIWLQDIFHEDLAASERVARVKLEKADYVKWFACMKELFGENFIRDGILEMVRRQILQGVQFLIIADADFTEEFTAAFKVWPKQDRQYVGVTLNKTGKGLFVEEGRVGVAVEQIVATFSGT